QKESQQKFAPRLAPGSELAGELWGTEQLLRLVYFRFKGVGVIRLGRKGAGGILEDRIDRVGPRGGAAWRGADVTGIADEVRPGGCCGAGGSGLEGPSLLCPVDLLLGLLTGALAREFSGAEEGGNYDGDDKANEGY